MLAGASQPPIPSTPARLGMLITSDEEGAADDGTLKVMETLAARGERFDYCVVGEPSSGDAARRHRPRRPPRQPLGDHDDPRRAGPRRLSAASRQSDPCARQVRRGDDAAAHRCGQRALPADDVSDGQCAQRRRRAERRSRQAQVPFQLPLLDRYGRTRRSRSASRTRSTSSASTTSIHWRVAGKPFLTTPGPLTARRDDGGSRGNGLGPGALDERGHVRRPIHRALWHRASSSSVRSTQRSTGQRARRGRGPRSSRADLLQGCRAVARTRARAELSARRAASSRAQSAHRARRTRSGPRRAC